MRIPTGLLIAFLAALAVLAGCKDAGQAAPTGVGCGGTTIASANGIWGGNYLHPLEGGNTVVGFIQDDRGVFFRCAPGTNCNPNFFDALYAAEFNPAARSGRFSTYEAIGPVVDATPLSMNFTTCLNIQLSGEGLRQQPTLILGRNDGLYNAPASVATVAGTWQYRIPGNEQQNIPDYTLTLNLGATGELDGTDTDGCRYAGSVSVRNVGRNIYRFDDVTLSSEGTPGCIGATDATGATVVFDGLYQGLGIVNDVGNIGAQVRQLHVILANSEHAFSIILGR